MPRKSEYVIYRVRPETKRVMERARGVRLDGSAAKKFAERLEGGAAAAPDWDAERHYAGGEDETADWIFVLDSLNFSFWPDPGRRRWSVEFKGRSERGYYALSTALLRAMGEGVPVADPAYYSKITDGELGRILRGNGEVPMAAERARILRENGGLLVREFGGSFSNLIRECGGSAAELVQRVFDEFPSFRDVQEHEGEKVHFLKRAQILAGDLWGSFGGRGLGEFEDIGDLTAFADYRVPQILRSLGILVYDAELSRIVDGGEMIPDGSPHEVEIRAGAVQGVEAVVLALREIGVSTNAHEVDWLLWNESHAEEHNRKPYHLTRTIWY